MIHWDVGYLSVVSLTSTLSDLKRYSLKCHDSSPL